MRTSQITFNIIHEAKGIDSALTEYAAEWFVVMASELPPPQRNIKALADVAGVHRNRLTHWLSELKVKDRIHEMWDELDGSAN